MAVTRSAAYSELRTRSLTTLGVEAARRDFDLVALLRAYDTSITVTAKGSRFTVDVPEAVAQQAWYGDMERSHNKMVGQFVTYGRMALGDFDPVWVAVTGYYSAFFCAQSLVSLAGVMFRRLPLVAPVASGTWRLTTAAVPGATGWVQLRGTAVRKSSHAAVLEAASDLLADLAKVAGTDPSSSAALVAGARLIKTPSLLSQFRNSINYSLEEGPWSRRPWSSELRSIRDSDDLTRRLATVRSSIKDEQRTELVMLLCALLATEVATEQRNAVSRPDLRDHAWRKRHCALLRGTPVESCLTILQP